MTLKVLCYSLQKSSASPTVKNETKVDFEVVSMVTDRSDLSDEMASLCAKLPIYRVKKATPLSVTIKRKCWKLLVYYEVKKLEENTNTNNFSLKVLSWRCMLNQEAILSGQNTFYEQLRLSLQNLYTVALFAVSKRRRKFF